MRIWSDAFASGQQVPQRYSRDGDNLSPPLAWAEVPEGAGELALLLENLTPETREPFAQWVVYGIPPEQGGLPEGFRHKQDPERPAALRQGSNDIGNVGYDGPQGSVGRRYRYRFRLLALDAPLGLAPGEGRETLLAAAAGHLLDEASIEAEYERPR